MSKTKTTTPDLRAALSWRGKMIRDTQTNELGLVVDARETEDGVRLVARFPSNPQEERLIALEPTDDLECLVPDMVKARYRPPRREDIEALRSRRRSA